MGSHRYIHCAEPAQVAAAGNATITTADVVLHLLGDPKWSEPEGEQDVREWMRARRRITENAVAAKNETLDCIELLPEDHEKLDYLSAHPTKGRGYRIQFVLDTTVEGPDGKRETQKVLRTVDVSAEALDHIDAIQYAKDRRPQPPKDDKAAKNKAQAARKKRRAR